MILRRLLLFVTLIALALDSSWAGGKKKGTSKAPSPPPAKLAISDVGANSVTIAAENTSKTLNVTQFTEITVNGQKAAISDLKPGMMVDVALRDPMTASRITAAGTR